jgi:hypothetical protein
MNSMVGNLEVIREEGGEKKKEKEKWKASPTSLSFYN